MALEQVILMINGQQLQTIYQGIDELPGKIGRQVFLAIAEQVQQQIDADEARLKAIEKDKAAALAVATTKEAEHPSE